MNLRNCVDNNVDKLVSQIIEPLILFNVLTDHSQAGIIATLFN